MISIVIPLYNKALTIAGTLSAVLGQTFHSYEVILINDGSTDGSAQVVFDLLIDKGYKIVEISQDHWVTQDGKFSLVSQPNGGVSRARNRGIMEAQYDYISLLDADDAWEPQYLATIVELIQKYGEHCDLFATAYRFYHGEGVYSDLKLNNLHINGTDGILKNYFEVASHSHPPIWSSNVVISKAALNSVHGFPVGIHSGEDLLTWARLAARYSIAYNLLPLAVFNQPESADFKPKRLPDPQNKVGAELMILWKETRAPGLKQYIGRWFEMRTSVYLRLGENKAAFRSLLSALRFEFKLKYIVYTMLIILPVKWRLKAFSHRSQYNNKH
jgi:Glycosyltransferases, probably involved in cell wall biogenesis